MGINPKRPLNLQDMERIRYISAPSVSPCGTEVAYVVSYADSPLGAFVSEIYILSELHSESLSQPRYLCEGERPRYSPDGKQLAYLAVSYEEKQIWVYDLLSGGHRPITTLRHGITDFAWSPQGDAIAFTTPVWQQEEEITFVPMNLEQRLQWEWQRENAPIVIEELMYKFDELHGFVDGSISRVGIVDLGSGEQTLIPAPIPCKRPVWSPSGSSIAYYGYPYSDAKATRAQVYLYDIGDQESRQITDEAHILDQAPVIFLADGKGLIYVSYLKQEEKFVGIAAPYLLQLETSSSECLFTQKQHCHGLGGSAIGRTAYGTENQPYYLKEDEDAMYFISSWDGCDTIFRLSLEQPAAAEKILDGPVSVHSLCQPGRRFLYYTRGDDLHIADLYRYDMVAGIEKRLTNLNPWLEERTLSQPEEMWVDSKDGKARIHGWVMPPVGQELGKRYPAVLDIHGGPQVNYSHDFWFELHYLAARGFAVVWCDPRGSAGYGAEFMSNPWGDEAREDLLTFLQAAEAKGYIDPQRIGVTGGSYGGWMTNRLITLTNKFKAAVTQRTLANLTTSYGTGDMGFVQTDESFTTMLDMLTNRARKSPIALIDSAKVPLLILHGTDDYRCSFEQAEQMFIAMKDRNPEIPVRFVAFPGENHGLTRSGTLKAQMVHLHEMTEWFRQYLQTEEEGEGADE